MEQFPKQEDKKNFNERHGTWFSKEAKLFQTLGAGTLGMCGALIGRVIIDQLGVGQLPPGGPEAALFLLSALSRHNYLSNRE